MIVIHYDIFRNIPTFQRTTRGGGLDQGTTNVQERLDSKYVRLCRHTFSVSNTQLCSRSTSNYRSFRHE